jgi:hypothetical protein
VSRRHHQCEPGDDCFHRFQGPQERVLTFAVQDRHKGVMAQHRAIQRTLAVGRNANSPVEHRRWHRLGLDGPDATQRPKSRRRRRKPPKLPAQPP